MIKDNLSPLTMTMCPPATLDEAVERLGELAGERSLMALIGAVFDDVEQFRAAISECRLSAKIDEIMNCGGRTITYKAVALGQDGTEHKLILHQWGPHRLQVINCVLSRAGDNWSDEDRKALKDLVNY